MREPERNGNWWIQVAAPRLVLAVLGLVSAACSIDRGGVGEESQPHIIVINIDDAGLDLLGADVVAEHFPNIDRYLQSDGMRFENMHVTDPLCGPSRASLLRGQYPHNTGIELNYQSSSDDGPTGSWAEFLARGYADEDLGTWMQRAGYFTALVGKYHHTEYPQASGNATFGPPGWSDFRASLGSFYFGTRRVINGEATQSADDEFRTDVEAADIVEIIQSHDPDQPLFVLATPFGPHGSDQGDTFAPRHADLFNDSHLDRTKPSFNEDDLSDKAPEVAQLPPLTPQEIDQLDERHRERLRSMMAIDDMVGAIFEQLEASEMVDDTYVMLTSDNGFLLGEHRATAKKLPFEEATRVGLIVAGPGITGGNSSDELLSHVDVTRTVLDLADAEQPTWLDGLSFRPLLDGGQLATDRPAILIENQEAQEAQGISIDARYQALRLPSEMYVEWEDGAREYYDLASDPYQLLNRYDDLDDSRKSTLADQLAQLRSCSGANCSGVDGEASPLTIDVQRIGLTNGEFSVQGSVTPTQAGSTIDRVELVIRSTADNSYWDGESFSATPARITADVDESDWSWSYDTPLPEGAFWVGAWAVDVDGNRNERISASVMENTIVLDPSPIASFTTPPEATLPPSDVRLTGLVASEQGAPEASAVFLRVSRLQDDFRQYWDGDEWTSQTNTWLETSLAPDQSWISQLDLAPGTYQAHAYASDLNGTFQTWDHGRPWINFYVE